MNLENLVAVSGMSGIFRIAANRNNGLIIEDLITSKKKFASSRRHQFSPLESIAIFTDDGDSVELKKVFQNMLEQLDDNPPVSANARPDELHEYFTDVLPNYDKEKVRTGDIKKVIKWFEFLHQNDLFSLESPSSDEENKEEEE
jgi:hypothetical protein